MNPRPDRPSSTDVARVRERLEDRADSTEALDSAVGVAYNEGLIRDLREAASLLADYEARGEALRLIASDDYPEAWGAETARAMRDFARETLK